MKSNVYTAKGFARLLKRGLESTYTANGIEKHVHELWTMFKDMGMARHLDAAGSNNGTPRARSDSEWFLDLVDELAEYFRTGD